MIEPLAILEEEVQAAVRLIDAFGRHSVDGAPGSAFLDTWAWKLEGVGRPTRVYCANSLVTAVARTLALSL